MIKLPTAHNFKNLTGQQFDRLRVIGFAGRNKTGQTLWKCQCVCGTTCVKIGVLLTSCVTRSCGCLNAELAAKRKWLHGESNVDTPEYRSYCSARGRCNNPRNAAYARYGGVGIQFMFTSFQDFLAHIGRRPSQQHSLDRFPNPAGHYEKGNVRWATLSEQSRNRRDRKPLTANGQTLLLCEWAILLNVTIELLHQRRTKYKWCDDCVVNVPISYSHHNVCSHR